MKTHVVLFLSFCLLHGAFCNDSRVMNQRLDALEKICTDNRVGNHRLDALEKNFQSLEENINDIASMMRSILAGKLQMSPPETQREEPKLNATVEERVTLLEFQVSDLGSDLEAVEDEVTILSSGDLNQDQRILELEIDSDGFEDSIESLIATDIFVTQELTSVNENILDLQDRVQAQEVSGVIAFQAWVGQYEAMSEESVVLFGVVDVNLGNGFNILTGEFLVPSGGSGLYYFRFGYSSNYQLFSDFIIRKNGVEICRAFSDINNAGVSDRENSSCAGLVTLVEGDVIDVYYASGTNDTPVINGVIRDNLFTGFRIAPQ